MLGFLKNIQSRARLRLFFISGINQALSSGTNFLISLYLVNEFGPESFGVYGIGFAIILFIGGLVNALFLTQMIVIYPKKDKRNRDELVSTVLNLILLFSGFLLVLTAVIVIINSFIASHMSNWLILGVLTASISYVLKEYYVRVAYNFRKEQIAVRIHSAILITVVLLYWVAGVLWGHLNVPIAFFIFGVGHLVGGFIGVLTLKILPTFTVKKNLKNVFNELWKNGKWASISNLVFSFRAQAHTIIATLLIGSVGVGNLNAARLFIAPAIMVIPVISQLAMPRLASLRESDKLGLIKQGQYLTYLYLMFGTLYSLILLVLYDNVVSVFFNESYDDIFYLTFLWCIYSISVSIRNGQDIIAQVVEKFKNLTTFNLMSAIVTLATSFICGKAFGLEGILYGLITGEIFLFLLIYWMIRREKKVTLISYVD